MIILGVVIIKMCIRDRAYIIDKEKVESVALILSGSYHEQKSMYDRTPYNVYQNNVYASLLYEKEFSPAHSLSTGLSMNYDGFNENLLQNDVRKVFDRTEVVPGAYVQYTYNLNDKLILLGGIKMCIRDSKVSFLSDG